MNDRPIDELALPCDEIAAQDLTKWEGNELNVKRRWAGHERSGSARRRYHLDSIPLVND